MLRQKSETSLRLSHKLAAAGASLLLLTSPWSVPETGTGADKEQMALVFPSQNLGSGAMSGQQDDVSSASDVPARRGFNLSRMIFKLY